MNWFLRACFLMLGCSACAADERPPNIVFIYADDLGWGDLQCHGHPEIKTPNLNRLASEGTDFQQFTVVNPVCSPSRTAIMTGMFPSRLGIHQHFADHASNVERGMPDWLDPDVPTLPRALQAAGYATAHYGKWHLSGGAVRDAPDPTEYGIDDFATWTGGSRHVFDGTQYAQMISKSAAHDVQAASFLSVAATDHALRFIREKKDQPFFINLWLHETHALVTATEQEKAQYAHVAEPERTYFAAVSRADRQVGRVLETLDQLGLSENTLVIFSSDNGPENPRDVVGHKLYHSRGSTGGLRGRKRSLLMGGVNVPFLARWPGVVPAGRVDQQTPIAGVDMLPTLLAAAKVSVPKVSIAGIHQVDGENLLDALHGKSVERSKPLFWFWQGHHGGDDWPAWAMRDGRWILIQDETKQRVELYDVIQDRKQSQDLAAKYPERVAAMSSQLAAWENSLPKGQIAPELQSRSASSGARKNNSGQQPTKPSLIEVRTRAFQRKDADQNDWLSLDEYLLNVKDTADFTARFRRFDTNNDGKLTRQEYIPTPTAE